MLGGMKHWVPASGCEGVALPVALRPAKRAPALPSVVGLVLAVGLLAGLAWALAPVDPIAREVRD